MASSATSSFVLKAKLLLIIIIANLLLFSSNSFAQFADYRINVNYHYGFVMNHSVNMAHLANQRPFSIEADLFRQTNGKKEWEQVHNFPKVGYSFNYVHTDPTKPIGNCYSLVFYMGKDLLKSNNLNIYYRIGGGPGFINRTFDLKTNHKNNIISSKFNYCLNGRVNISQKLYKQIYMNAGLGIIHFSNGNLKVPNLGINVPTVHIGLGFGKANTPKIIRDTLSPFKKENNLYVSVAGGLKQNYPILGPYFGIGVFSIYGGRTVSRKSILQAGLEVFYDPSIQRTLERDLNAIQNSSLGLLFGHELTFNKLSLLTQGGIYLYDPYKLYQPWYQRYGLKYYLCKELFLGVFLKSHYGSADFVEWTFGVKI